MFLHFLVVQKRKIFEKKNLRKIHEEEQKKKQISQIIINGSLASFVSCKNEKRSIIHTRKLFALLFIIILRLSV